MSLATAADYPGPPPDPGSRRSEVLPLLPEYKDSLHGRETVIKTDAPQDPSWGRPVTPLTIPPLRRRIEEPAPQDRFELHQQWEGAIESVSGDTVTAILRDLTDRTQPEEIVDLPLEEFSPNDADLVAPGAVFYWSIGYRITPTGTKERVSRFRMRRLPPPTRRQLERIARDTDELASLFGLPAPVAAR